MISYDDDDNGEKNIVHDEKFVKIGGGSRQGQLIVEV
jgi:hypothetical protein